MMSASGAATNGLCISAALLYIGLSLVIDPVGAARRSALAARRLREFDLVLRGFSALNRFPLPEQSGLSRTARLRVRLTGLGFIGVAFLFFGLVMRQYL
jgi:hypothetical protein